MKTMILAMALAGVATGALAADLPTHKTAPAPAASYYKPFTWGGLYGGINGGFARGSLSSTNFASPNTGLLGGTIGYNWQMGQIVFGGEADLGYAFGKASNSFASGVNTYKLGWLTTERLRLGYAMDRALFYVTGGYAGVSTRGTVNALGNSYAQDSWRSGGVVGGGIEYAFTNNISAKAEYLWAPLQDKTYWAGKAYSESDRMSLSIARVGLNYKF